MKTNRLHSNDWHSKHSVSRCAAGAFLSLLAALTSSAQADSDADFVATAPLGVRTQGVLRELFLDPVLLDARPRTGMEIDLRWSAANSWSIPTQMVRKGQGAELWTDEQADSLTARVRLPWSVFFKGGPTNLPGSAKSLSARVSTAIEWRATEHWGGWSDGAIAGFHNLIGGFGYDRNLYPANQTRLQLRDQNAVTVFDLHAPTLALGDLVARTEFDLVDGSRGALALRFDVKAPTGTVARAGSSGGWDESLGLAGTLTLGSRFTLHAMATIAQFGHFSQPIELQPKRWHATGDLSLAFKLGAVELLLEDRLATPLLEPGWTRVEFGGSNGLISSALNAAFRPHNQVSLGARWRGFTFWLSEDYTPGANPRSTITWVYVSNSPDIVAGLSWTKAF